MRKSYTLLSASMLSMTLLSGCMQNPSTEQPRPTVSITPSNIVSQPQVPASTTPKKPKLTEADQAKQAMAAAKPKPASVKMIKSEPAGKAGKRLSPQEVEDLIRKLSVCRPS